MNVLVLGGGESGRGVALLAQAEGYQVRVSDAGVLSASAKSELEAANIPFEEGGHTRADIEQLDLIVKSPGIPWKADFVAFAKTHGVEVLGEMEFCARFAERRHQEVRRIGITGSNGKTTTTLLTTHLLQAVGLRAVAGGNVGTSYARLLLTPDDYDWIVLELSSFQLEDIKEFRVDIGMMLNLSPDHLDRYGGNFEAYAAAKYKLKDTLRPADGRRGALGYWLQASDEVSLAHDTGWMGDFSLLNMPASFKSGVAQTPWGEVSLTQTQLLGPHNAANATFALFAATLAIGLSEGQAAEKAARPILEEALTTFANAPHRLEHVGFVHGVQFVNDSKATNLDAVDKALASFTQPIVWIVGGEDKGNDYALLAGHLHRLRAIVAMGVDNSKIIRAFADTDIPVFDTHSLNIAIVNATEAAKSGDVVLLSPACASFDLFRNYIDRGDQFREAVQALPGFRETL